MAKSKKMNSKQNNAAKKNTSVFLWVGLAAVVLIVAAVVFLLQRPQNQANPALAESMPREVSVAQASEYRDQGAFILDVRQPDEWEQVHIPGATLIPLGELSNRLNEVPKDQEVVVVCRSGNRSAQGRDILLGAGFSQVTSMAGGMNEWQAAGLPTATGK